ncbi:aminoacyl--tRNA ligase-related protein [Streptomyces sp. NPDC059258]|uniref:aminoacyl--tRNA ligase-related protein n=1 Tax=unclassified Streptomyces TaxID=2593676 RepID=UPI0036CA742B
MPTRETGSRGFSVDGGLATLGPQALGLRTELDRYFTAWGTGAGALTMAYPPVVPASELAALDYWDNFPHLAMTATGLRPDRLTSLKVDAEHPAVDHQSLRDAGHVLPSSACYPAYLDLAGATVRDNTLITTVATCFRNEEHYDGLRRLMGFTMREVIFLGTREEVLDRVAEFKRLTSRFVAELGLPVDVRAARDPFFGTDAPRALMLSLFPAKEEFVYGESVAVSSVNFHRNFFGERCGIRTEDGEYAFSGCIGFGLERWLHSLVDHFGSFEAARDRVRAVVTP